MKKNALVLGIIIILAYILWNGTTIQTVDEFYLQNADVITEDSETITLQINSEAALFKKSSIKKELHPYLANDGWILKPTQYVLRPNDTVFDIVQRITRYEKIQFEYQGASENIYQSAYIQGINYLYEFSCGPLSGWMYAVNDNFPSVGVSQFKLKDGDQIALYYTCDLGRDLNAGWMVGNE